MKKTLFVALISSFGLYASAQSLDMGLRGGPASTWLFNTNVFNAGSDQDVSSSISSEFGAHFELNFLGGTGIELDVIYSKYTQKYKGSFIDSGGLYQNTMSDLPNNYYQRNESYTSSTELTLIKLPLLFHYQTKTGFSIEVGPEYCIVNDAVYSATYSGQPILMPSAVSFDSKSQFNSSSFNAVLGFGWNVKLIPSGKLYLLTDLRFEYGITDLKGTDALGENLDNSGTNPVYLAHSYRGYSSYAGTHMLDASFSIGLFYRLNLVPGVHSFM
ncbi:MAG TPA: outer membrane beta-barrel protein [Bacteroidia bacterium]|jgi:hypothetical protein|nr:outer membrane beta-barrel protein [Bacteroidia bacterium]